ncbi:FHA domain-containing protein [Kitasatospora sp. A2-31]|uniref:FHA domain-containing protein n=1 Tax=Kitasatospora sp. A2-31 TaxID=2916414 RepID=UPI001EE9BCBF|nr:FHA domain-containing protein [Kitasatospora sp. A2-31]MCG6496026.1 FHA domain-containing protein [Kitasatospora sp. A2-31]
MSPPSRELDLPRLVVDSPDRLKGQVFVLADEPMLVGRSSDCQIHVGDPGVSRRHAVVWRTGGHTTVEDLSSTNGTKLNGHLVSGQEEVHAGDVLDFGPFEVHYEEPRDADVTVPGVGAPGPTASFRTVQPPTPTPGPGQPRPPHPERPPGPPQGRPAAPRPPGPATPPAGHPTPPHYAQPGQPPPPGEERRFDVRDQQAWNLNNVAGNQYNVMQERRDNFFREIAATRTRARHLIVTGFVMFLVGGGVYFWALMRFISAGSDAVNSESTDYSVPDLLGPKIGGVPVGAIGFAAATIGTVLMVIGIVLHIVTTSRRRRFEEDESRRFNVPPPAR